jgi:hypothetical protein
MNKKKLTAKGRNFLWQEETSHHSMKPPITGENFLSHEQAFKDWHTKRLTYKEIEIAENVRLLQNA